MMEVSVALEAFKLHTGSYPTEQMGLASLVSNPGVTNWYGPYLLAAGLTDAWGHPYRYRLTNGVPKLRSAGPDGKLETTDDKTE